jgi:hypothetical protein
VGKKRSGIALLVGAALLFSVASAAEEDVPMVDGRDWKESAPVLKRAYLIGLSNLLSAEYAYQQEFGPPPDRQTAIQRLYEEIDAVSLDEVIERTDKWYEDHPDEQDTAVLGVIWLDMVRPNLPAARRYDQDAGESEGKR